MSLNAETDTTLDPRAEEALRTLVRILARDAAREWFEASCAAAAPIGLGEERSRESLARRKDQPIMGRPAGSAQSSGRKPMKR